MQESETQAKLKAESEGLADRIGVHVNALVAIGGVPKAVFCDNLKAGVAKPSRYEPASIAPMRRSPSITVLLFCRRFQPVSGDPRRIRGRRN